MSVAHTILQEVAGGLRGVAPRRWMEWHAETLADKLHLYQLRNAKHVSLAHTILQEVASAVQARKSQVPCEGARLGLRHCAEI